ncbi:hypothetical protein BBF96_06960 [Anoxybacter fermentans]|uniref:DUF4342 domain-containing protein n=2 Tax=Anoxybacter fermentans TaxID=1323375 RepID=A0A3S9T2U9_9FIRM|nr:hypothetical protein BBF96_06960 [Anoxybacter fermentans]
MIRERTGVSYGEADAALTRANGDVVKAIIDLEEKAKQSKVKEEFWVKGNELVDKVKELIKKGNVTRIIVKNEEGVTLVEIPVTLGVLGTMIAPYVAILGGLAALVTRCKIVIEKREPVEKHKDGENEM